MDMTATLNSTAYREAVEAVKARVTSSRTSFHAGMAILPIERRDAMYAFYAFCREVDDIADDSPSIEVSQAGLNEWRERIAALFCGTPSDEITAALVPAVTKYNLVEHDFQDVISGMAMDSQVICAPSEKDLDTYCDLVASAVGRVSVRIFGDASSDAMTVAHYLGRALQLTNILRDLSEDATRCRLYLPEELLAKHGVQSRVPSEILKDPQLRPVCRELAKRAGDYFEQADAAMRICKASAMRPAKIMRGYYGTIHQRLIAEDWRDLTARVSLPKWQKILILFRYLVF